VHCCRKRDKDGLSAVIVAVDLVATPSPTKFLFSCLRCVIRVPYFVRFLRQVCVPFGAKLPDLSTWRGRPSIGAKIGMLMAGWAGAGAVKGVFWLT